MRLGLLVLSVPLLSSIASAGDLGEVLKALDTVEKSIGCIKIEYQLIPREIGISGNNESRPQDWLWARQGRKELLSSNEAVPRVGRSFTSCDGEKYYEIFYHRTDPSKIRQVRISTKFDATHGDRAHFAYGMGWTLPLNQGSLRSYLTSHVPESINNELVDGRRCLSVTVPGFASEKLTSGHTLEVAFDEEHRWMPRRIHIVPDVVRAAARSGATTPLTLPLGALFVSVNVTAYMAVQDPLANEEMFIPSEFTLESGGGWKLNVSSARLNDFSGLPSFVPQYPTGIEIVTDFATRHQKTVFTGAEADRAEYDRLVKADTLSVRPDLATTDSSVAKSPSISTRPAFSYSASRVLFWVSAFALCVAIAARIKGFL